MIKKVLIPLPANDFDPTEAGVPWRILKENGVEVIFATPQGDVARCDSKMLNGNGLGYLAPILSADENGRTAYTQMSQSREFIDPIAWSEIQAHHFDGVLLPGGHAKGMREYLESPILQKVVSDFFLVQKPVGAICHGVVLAARSKSSHEKSVLFGRKTTSLLASQELTAWALTCLWLGDYYRTYAITVEAEVTENLASKADFVKGPIPLLRDSPRHLERGFCVVDQNYLSARWPGDAHAFGNKFLALLR